MFDFFYIAGFASAALIFGCGSLALLFAWFPTRRWVPAEARLQFLEVTPRAGKYVRMNPVVKAKYTYTYKGQNYESSRISVFEVRPRLFNGYDPTALRLLDESTIVEEPVIIKLDPEHPQRAVLLDPPVRNHLLTGFLFAILSGIALAFVVHGDSSTVSIAAGWSIAGILFLIALLFRDGSTVLMIFG